jgi:hypothetical protein
MQNTLDIHRFMILPNDQKSRYINQYQPNRDDVNTDAEHDVRVFTAEELKPYYKGEPICEVCQAQYADKLEIPMYAEYIGTPDTREPKYCFQHYTMINYWSTFTYWSTSNTLKIAEFMQLGDNDMIKYQCRSYPRADGNKEEYNVHGIDIYYHGSCDKCGLCASTTEANDEIIKLIGTDDCREPRFCEPCYTEINLTSDFILTPQAEHAEALEEANDEILKD